MATSQRKIKTYTEKRFETLSLARQNAEIARLAKSVNARLSRLEESGSYYSGQPSFYLQKLAGEWNPATQGKPAPRFSARKAKTAAEAKERYKVLRRAYLSKTTIQDVRRSEFFAKKNFAKKWIQSGEMSSAEWQKLQEVFAAVAGSKIDSGTVAQIFTEDLNHPIFESTDDLVEFISRQKGTLFELRLEKMKKSGGIYRYNEQTKRFNKVKDGKK